MVFIRGIVFIFLFFGLFLIGEQAFIASIRVFKRILFIPQNAYFEKCKALDLRFDIIKDKYNQEKKLWDIQTSCKQSVPIYERDVKTQLLDFQGDSLQIYRDFTDTSLIFYVKNLTKNKIITDFSYSFYQEIFIVICLGFVCVLGIYKFLPMLYLTIAEIFTFFDK